MSQEHDDGDYLAALEFLKFQSRRSVVHSANGMVACTQPLAAEAGQRILKNGGNAADAAVAMAAALNMTEPCSTGIGGDVFCLFFDAKTRRVHALNASGRSPKNLTLNQIHEQLQLGPNAVGNLPFRSALSVTVPGAPAGWIDTVQRFGSGKLTMAQILQPAIELGEHGFPVSEVAAEFWSLGEQELRDASPNFREMLRPDQNAKDGVRAPRAGEMMRNPTLAETFRTLAREGKEGFYKGRIARAIVDVIKAQGGHMELSDLENHANVGSEETCPISLKYQKRETTPAEGTASSELPSKSRSIELWEHPPNGQGIIALMALGIFEELQRGEDTPVFQPQDHNSATYLHTIIESLKIAFADGSWWITDPAFSKVSPEELVAQSYLASRAKLFDSSQAKDHTYGQPGPSPAHNHCDTVYLCAADKYGNGISFINSNYEGFGSAIVPEGCGFTIQNRGANFQLGPADHPNLYAPGKRPYHTIIPGLITTGDNESSRELHSVYGVMGGFMQPQGHLQVLLNMELFGMDPQRALDAPRVCISANSHGATAMHGATIFIEEGIDEDVVRELQALGHQTEVLRGRKRVKFGRGQIISRRIDDYTGEIVWSAGSDARGDGCAMPA